jgi:RNA polymerase sigma factor (sigma-70 family)
MHGAMEPEPLAPGPTDRDLLCGYTGGDQGAFEALYDRYARPLFTYLHSLTEDVALAEDLLQDCFLRLVGQSPFRLEESVRGLLYTIARNLARDEARRASVRQRNFPALVEPGADGEAISDTLEALAQTLPALPVEQREVVVLKFHADLTFAEIGLVTGVPESTVKSRYRYALDKLAELLPEE